ncbi:hypothetical protein Tco_0291735 [Tanacetum coccineum]
MARRGLHTDIDKDDSEGSDEVDEQEESVTGTKIPINPVPVAMKTPSIATYKIIKQGEKGAYQIVREDGTDIVYINFGAMLKSISKDDLTELYRIVMNKYGIDGPEDKLEKIFWKYLKDMFEEPLSTDPVWSLLSQQRIISWRYYDTCRVHCLNLESMDIYMLSERKYPLSAEQILLQARVLTPVREDWDLLHEDLEQIDDLDIEEMDINWQIAMIAIRMKKFYKKTGRRVRVDRKAPVGFDKKKLECFNCHNTGHFMGLLTMDDGIVNWGEHTEDEETNHALMAISSSSEDSTGVIGTSSVHSVDFESEIQSTSEVLSHLIKDYDYYEKKMAREAAPKKQRVFNTGNRVTKPWNNADRINHANHFVPRLVILNSGRPNVNSVRPNVNTVRTHINSVRQNVNSVWSNINTGRINVNSVRPRVSTVSSNVNTVRSRQPVPTRTSNSFSPKRPQVNQFNQRKHFSKSYSPVRRPIDRNTAKMSYFNAVKGNWGSVVKTSAGYNWRPTRPNSNCNGGPTFIRSSTQEHGR